HRPPAQPHPHRMTGKQAGQPACPRAFTGQPLALDGTAHVSHKEQGSMIRRYIIWRNKHAADERLCKIVARAHVA
ncbi:hypothetical protein ABZT29_18205, partial [Streptomyces prasinus]